MRFEQALQAMREGKKPSIMKKYTLLMMRIV